jgi:chorismate mutase
MYLEGGLFLETQLLLVDSSIVPSVFLKVLKAKRLLSKGVVKSSSDACKAVGISRSAFYKYKDGIFSYEDQSASKTVTLYLRLSDEPGILSSVLSALYQFQANILTVNQNIPIDGVADVTVTIRIDAQQTDGKLLLECLKKMNGVIECKRV